MYVLPIVCDRNKTTGWTAPAGCSINCKYYLTKVLKVTFHYYFNNYFLSSNRIQM